MKERKRGINKNKIAILGVVFPSIKNFLKDYLTSLDKQTFKDFDLIIINDKFGSLEEYKKEYQINIKEISGKGLPAKNRELGINYLKNEGYDYIIFTDADDFFSFNRVEKSLEHLDKHDIVVNDLTIVSFDGTINDAHYISNRIQNLTEINFDYIIDKNILGFSNTAIRLKCLKEDVYFDGGLIAVDWYFFSRLLKEGCKAIFTNEAITFYRSHESNTIGLSSNIVKEKIESGIEAKLVQYRNLCEIDDRFDELYKKFSIFRKKMIDDNYKKNYVEKINNLGLKKPLWWEAIKLPEEVGLCE